MPEFGATLPSTVAFIGYHAVRHPDALAVVDHDHSVTYAEFYRDIGKMVAAFREQGLQPRQKAAIGIPDFYAHWLVVLACEALGVATMSYDSDEGDTLQRIFSTMDAAWCAPSRLVKGPQQVAAADQAWLDRMFAHEAEDPIAMVPAEPDTPLRLVKSSGTTGARKTMWHTGRVRQSWLDRYQLRTCFNAGSRYLVSRNISVEAYHAYITACLRAGGTCIRDGRIGIAAALAKFNITHVTLLPYMLIDVLDNLPADYAKPSGLTICTIGAPVSTAVRARVHACLSENIIESYGANECGPICSMEGDGMGIVVPGVRVEVADETGAPVVGTAGQARIQSDSVVPGYTNDDAATQRMFRDGWFYPGDVAVKLDENRLQLLGRDDDLMNIRGIKMSPLTLEERLRAALPVDDLCLTLVDDGEGRAQVCVALVQEAPGEMAKIKRIMAPMMPAMFGAVRLVHVDEIPRTPTGKIRRRMLADALRSR